jgi:hypothetical protein
MDQQDKDCDSMVMPGCGAEDARRRQLSAFLHPDRRVVASLITGKGQGHQSNSGME